MVDEVWLALRPEVLGADALERFVGTLAGPPPFTKDGTDTPRYGVTGPAAPRQTWFVLATNLIFKVTGLNSRISPS